MLHLSSLSQPAIKIPLWLTDSTDSRLMPATLYFGFDSNATSCIDTSLGEVFMFTECGLMSQRCAQFFPPPIAQYCGDETDFPVFSDYRTLTGFSQSDTFSFGFVGKFPVTVHWTSSIMSKYLNRAQMVDFISFISGLPVKYSADMLTCDSLVISDRKYWKFIIITGDPKITDVDERLVNKLPLMANLQQNYPNPFNPQTKIDYSLAHRSYVLLRIYDILGRDVRTLVNRIEEPGVKTVAFDGNTLPSGIYFYRLEAVNVDNPRKVFTQIKKMELIQ
jgi:hypothetical protein